MSSSSSSDSDQDFISRDYADVGDAANHFAFDPLASSDDSGSDESADSDESMEEARAGNVNWCQCGRCRPMETAVESLCCREVPRAHALVPQGAGCVTEHRTFAVACLDIGALEVAYYGLMEERPGIVQAPDIHTRYRYTAYRQFVRWVWHRLGRGNRTVLPSCVVAAIRETFPSEDYCGFRYPEY